MESLEALKTRIEATIPGVQLAILPNDAVADQRSLLVDVTHAEAVARFLQTDPELQFDYCSSVAGVDWLDATVKEKVRSKRLIEGVETEVEELVQRTRPGYLEVVYHLFSMARKQGPIILRQRTLDRHQHRQVASLTLVYRGAELQEREVYDLYGILFDGHPDLRRILMWENFQDYPMRKDYQEPEDYEYEPTPHGDVLAKARAHYRENQE